MARIDFLQFKHNLSSSTYSMVVSFNGAPVTPTAALNFVDVLTGFSALGPIGMEVKTYSFSSNHSHLNLFDHGDLGKIYEGVATQVRGGGIIKTTNYPPPHSIESYNPVNGPLLDDLYIQELTISRIGLSSDFTVSGIVSLIPGRTRNFEIESLTFTRGKIGPNPRGVLSIKVRASVDLVSSRPFSTLFSNASHLTMNDPCTLIVHEGNFNLALDYKKNGWFFIH